MSVDLLKKSLREAPIIKKGNYRYIINPITDGVPEIKPELLKEVVSEMQKRIEPCRQIDKIVTIEAMGIHLATVLSLKMNVPFTIIRKRAYGLPDEVRVEQVTGYSRAELYINGLKKGDNIIIVDDVLSTGGTLRAVISALKKIGVKIEGVFIAVDKGNVAKEIARESDVNVDALVSIDVNDDTVVIK